MPVPIIIPIDASGGGVARQTYVDRLADELGFLLTTTVSATATTGEARRVVLADELRDDEAGQDLRGAWLYALTGDQAGTQNRILSDPEAGHLGPDGAAMLARPFAAPLEAGDTIKITGPLPVVRYGTTKGLVDGINEALARIWIKARLSFTGNGTDSYDLGAYPWLREYEQTRGIYEVPWDDPTRAPVLAPYAYRIVTSGETRALVTDRPSFYGTDETFYLDVAIRAERLVYDGVSWTYATVPGLQDDADRAAVAEEVVVAFAMVKCLQFLTRSVLLDRGLAEAERRALLADIAPRRRTYAILANRLRRKQSPTPLPERRESLVAVGSPGWWG